MSQAEEDLQRQLCRQRDLGHGEGQEHALNDVARALGWGEKWPADGWERLEAVQRPQAELAAEVAIHAETRAALARVAQERDELRAYFAQRALVRAMAAVGPWPGSPSRTQP